MARIGRGFPVKPLMRLFRIGPPPQTVTPDLAILTLSVSAVLSVTRQYGVNDWIPLRRSPHPDVGVRTGQEPAGGLG